MLRKKSGAEASQFFSDNPSFQHSMRMELYEVVLPSGTNQFTLKYAGEVFHPVKKYGEEYARSFSVSPGIVSPEGIVLSGSSIWYPYFVDELVTFHLDHSDSFSRRTIVFQKQNESWFLIHLHASNTDV